MTTRGERIGVVLFQLGGPDSPAAVEPFLRNLFSDPDIFDFPLAGLVRPVFARVISKLRASRVRANYDDIGGCSPIRELTERQARALEITLGNDIDARVVVAMRYWKPTSDDAIEELRAARCERLVLLPMYPQYSLATTSSSLNEWHRRTARAGFELPTVEVAPYYDAPSYIRAVVERVREALSRFPEGVRPHLVFSAHGLPLKLIERGDPYQGHVEKTVAAVLGEGEFGLEHSLCYQSRVGPERWLEPGLLPTLERLGGADERAVLVVPIAFVSDHIETLSEIDIEARRDARRWGIRHFETMAGLNDSEPFIEALTGLVRAAISDSESSGSPSG